MRQKVTGDIDSTYRAQAHNLKTLKSWHSQHSFASKILLSAQVIFPVISTLFLSLYFVYLFELEPQKTRIKLAKHIKAPSKEISGEAKATVWITFTISFLFTVCTIVTDIIALLFYNYLPNEVRSYINDEDTSEFIYLRAVPTTMLTLDSVTFLIHIIIIPSLATMCIDLHARYNPDKENVWMSGLLYTILSPLTCLATHSYHIIFAFINNPYHATSILLIYMMTLVILVVIFNKIFHFVSQCDKIEDDCCKICLTLICYVSVSLVIAVPIGLTVAILLILPITNAVDEASNQIYSIYQASVTVFAALVTWKLFSGDTNSVFAVLRKAKDNRTVRTTPPVSWENMSDKEKEIYLGVKFLDYFRINTDSAPLFQPNSNRFRTFRSNRFRTLRPNRFRTFRPNRFRTL